MSNKTDLATYQFQLGQVQEALDKDPENSDLLKLKSDLLELVNLYTGLVSQETAKTLQKDQTVKSAEKPESTHATHPTLPAAPTLPVDKKEKKEKPEQSDLVVGEVKENKVKKKYVAKKERKPSKRDLELNQKQADWKSFNSKKQKKSL